MRFPIFLFATLALLAACKPADYDDHLRMNFDKYGNMSGTAGKDETDKSIHMWVPEMCKPQWDTATDIKITRLEDGSAKVTAKCVIE